MKPTVIHVSWTDEPDADIALGQAVEDFLRSKAAANRRERYIDQLRIYLRMFTAAFGDHRIIRTFNVRMLEAWFRARGEKPALHRSSLGKLSSFFSWCERKHYIESNPVRRCERISVEEKTPIILSPRQSRRLMASARRDGGNAVAYCALALYAGVRPDEIRRLKWSDIDLDRGMLTVDAAASKVRRRRMVPLHQKCVAWLRTCPQTPGLVTRMTWRQIARIRWRAGIPRCQDILRHTAASYLLALHQDAGRVARWLGNSEAVLLRHYAELVSPDDCRRFWKTAINIEPKEPNDRGSNGRTDTDRTDSRRNNRSRYVDLVPYFRLLRAAGDPLPLKTDCDSHKTAG